MKSNDFWYIRILPNSDIIVHKLNNLEIVHTVYKNSLSVEGNNLCALGQSLIKVDATFLNHAEVIIELLFSE